MSAAPPLKTIPVGVIVERMKADSKWIDYLWRPTEVLFGRADAAPWTKLAEQSGRATFYAGPASIELHRTETSNYRDNLAADAPALWVVLRETGAEPPYDIYLVTADPSEGEAMTEAGNNIVESVPMPDPIREQLETFIAEHHVEQTFVKRKRDRANPEALGRRPMTRPRDEQ
jgi:hypothetical protein